MTEVEFWYWISELEAALRIDDWYRTCSAQGDCESVVSDFICDPIFDALAQSTPHEYIRRELQEYGAWSAEDLADHEMNLTRFVWITACNMREEEKAVKAVRTVAPQVGE